MVKSKGFIIAFSVAMVLIATSAVEGKNMNDLLPAKMHDWTAKDKGKIYDRETIYDYMNGAGELYNAYDFKRLLVQRFVKTGEPDIVVELFDMNSSKDAFGVFAHGQGREDKNRGIGQGSEYRGGLLHFWKGSFFVSILAQKETASSKEAVLSMGRAIAEGISVTGAKPALLNYLPSNGLIKKSIRYFRTHDLLNYHYYVSEEDILGLDSMDAEAVFARYHSATQNKDKGHLLLVQYKNSEQAKAALNGFMSAYMPEAVKTGIMQTEDGKWVSARLKGATIAVVFDAPAKAVAEGLIKAVKDEKQQNKK